jgi:hypothetical protein
LIARYHIQGQGLLVDVVADLSLGSLHNVNNNQIRSLKTLSLVAIGGDDFFFFFFLLITRDRNSRYDQKKSYDALAEVATALRLCVGILRHPFSCQSRTAHDLSPADIFSQSLTKLTEAIHHRRLRAIPHWH